MMGYRDTVCLHHGRHRFRFVVALSPPSGTHDGDPYEAGDDDDDGYDDAGDGTGG